MGACPTVNLNDTSEAARAEFAGDAGLRSAVKVDFNVCMCTFVTRTRA